jgi:hypothetical protein
VIKQTSCYASSRLGRLSVFWGDQVFIPTAPVCYTVSHHADILCSLGPMLSEADWMAKGMDKYGLIAQCAGGRTAQVEKVTHATAVQLLSSLGEIQSVGASLGSFSISNQLLEALLTEFASELLSKQGKLDSDPHLWMPMTLDAQAYVLLMRQKGIAESASAAHHARIRSMLAAFHGKHGTKDEEMFGAVDVGQGVLWWDYGQLKLYQANTLLMAADSAEAAMLRSFLGIHASQRVKDSSLGRVQVDSASCISSCAFSKGRIQNCVMSNVRCDYIDAQDCVLVNVTAERVVGRAGSIGYNLIAPVIELTDQAVSVGVFEASGSHFVINSAVNIDGGTAWEARVKGNDKSFEQVYEFNAAACPRTLEKVIAAAHDAAWQAI